MKSLLTSTTSPEINRELKSMPPLGHCVGCVEATTAWELEWVVLLFMVLVAAGSDCADPVVSVLQESVFMSRVVFLWLKKVETEGRVCVGKQ